MATLREDLDQGSSRIMRLIESWTERTRFDEWVIAVSDAFIASRLRLEGAAKLLDTTPVELQAVLNLATLEEDDLRLIGVSPPPKTTWLSLAFASSAGIKAAVAALQTLPSGGSPFHTVQDAIRKVEGPTVLERVAGLGGATIVHMGSKAKQYGVLSPNHRKALVDIGVRKRTGQALTPRQTAYVHGLLVQLVDAAVIRRVSPDGDQEHCDAVLDALGR